MKIKCISINILFVLFLFIFFSCSIDRKKIVFYVSPLGNDDNSGSIEEPFKSIEKAQSAVRILKQKNGIPQGGITVYLRKGVYPIQRTIRFTGKDNGEEGAPVIYCAYPGEEVLLNGGKVVDNFKPLYDKEAKSRIKAKYHSKIWQADLKALGITNYGKIKPTGFGRKFQPTGMELFFNGAPMTLARYPNEGNWIRIKSVPQTGKLVYAGEKGVIRFGLPSGRHYGRFVYNGDRPSGWQKDDDIWLHGYWTWDWADSYVKVKRIDTNKKEFILDKPHGVYGYVRNQRYYALNILEEMDSPGEWYLDRHKGRLYFWPPSPIEQGFAEVSVLEDLMVNISNANFIQIEGITFECSRGEAIKIEGGSHNMIDGCTIRNIGSNGIIVDGGHYNGVRDCDIYNIGDGGIIIRGGDRKTLSKGNNFAINNHIYHYSRINKTYRPAINLHGVGNLLAHNCIHDAPHTAVLFSGNDNIMEFNEVYDIAKETRDVGAFYIGRDWTQRGNIIRYNYFHHLHGSGLYGVNAVYLDDAASGTTVYGNIFYQAGIAVFVGGGHDNIIENNVFIRCNPSIHLDARGMNWARKSMQRGGNSHMYKKLEAVNFRAPPYSIKYPSLAKILDWGDPCMPRGNIFRTNLSYGGKWRDIDKDADEVIIENNYVEKKVPSSIDVKQGKLYPENEIILKDMNFKKIPFDSIGLYISKYRHSLPGK